ncbi:unnamed protein product [Paramecium pentaurelia]|uniref:1-phosphatidylinositol-3-phosphate 5-kinase n=1 Tax=Paramecium pentaurelia TaxID=43138 RepID=A0A8S1XM69_9CILI|nr:unnamed protein product [Paramecium pentaurelia]
MDQQLSGVLIKRDKWKAESKVTKCEHCDRQFYYLFRTKHHCRKCGLVFCSDCSSNFIDGIHFVENTEKKVRLCGVCYDQVLKLLKAQGYKLENTIETRVVSVSIDKGQLNLSRRESIHKLDDQSYTISRSQTTQVTEEQEDNMNNDQEFNPEIVQVSIQSYFPPEEQNKNKESELLKSQLSLLKDKCYQYMENICDHSLKIFIQPQRNHDNHFDGLKSTTFEFVKKAVEDIQFSSLNSDPLDITCYVKTKLLPYKDYSLTCYFPGIVIRKNIALKRMQTELFKPRILIIHGNLDFIEETQQFDDFILKEKRVLQDYIEKIKENFKPTIIIVEKSVSKVALDICCKFNITVVQNVKIHQLRKIAKSTGSKFVRLDKLDGYIQKETQVTGNCEKIFFRNFPRPNPDKQDVAGKDNTLMFIETKDGKNGVTIMLSGPQEDLLQKLKQCIIGCMRLGKHFDVERYIILCEQKLRQNKQFNFCVGDFTKFLFEKVNLKEVIKPDLAYVKINYARADIHNFNDIKDMNALLAYQKEFPPQKEKVVDFFADMCNMPTEKPKAYYHSNDDMSMGAFIILKVANLQFRCEYCKLPRNSHVSIYYNAGRYVKFSVDGQMNQIKQIVLQKEQSQIQQSDENKTFLLKDLPSIIKQNHSNEKIQIETYFECNLCMQQLTDRVILSQKYLEYSFLRFLQQLFLTQNITINNYHNISSCNHTQIQRVYSYYGYQMKVMVGEFDVYQTTLLNFQDNSFNDYLKVWEQNYIKQLRDELMNKLNTFGITLINLIPKSLAKSEIDLLIKSIKQLKEECEKIHAETQYISIFQILKQSQDFGLQYKNIMQSIQEHKKKKELNPDFKNIIQNAAVNLKNQESILTNNTNTIKTTYELEKVDSGNNLNEVKQYHSNQELEDHHLHSGQKHSMQEIEETNHRASSGKTDLSDLIIPPLYSPELDIQQQSPLFVRNHRRNGSEIHNNNNYVINLVDANQGLLQQSIQKTHHDSNKDLDNVNINQSNNFIPTIDINQNNNFQKEWNISSFLAEQQKLIKSQMIYEFVPIYENQPLSYLSFTLNHPKYINEIYQKENFGMIESVQKSSEQAKLFFQQLLSPKEQKQDVENIRYMSVDLGNNNINQQQQIYYKQDNRDIFVLKINYDVEKKNEKSNNQIFQQQQQFQNNLASQFDEAQTIQEKSLPLNNPQQFVPTAQARKNKWIEVLIYFPTQFEALRLLAGITLAQFIKSISSTNIWSASGGKSQSKFYKSNDELFVFKKLEQDKEFMMFKQFALDYFKHMYRHFYESKPSLLSKIFGMFEIRDRGQTEYYLVMENLYFGMGDPSNLLVYDLKGSETNRLEKKKKGVLLDTNFRIDRNSEPIPILKENYRYNDRAFQIDCKFLNKQNVIDYSLLLIIDQKQKKLRMGIIDYLRFYTWDKETEHYLKYLLKGGMVPTIVNPGDYKKRFINAILKYFIPV